MKVSSIVQKHYKMLTDGFCVFSLWPRLHRKWVTQAVLHLLGFEYLFAYCLPSTNIQAS